jgi:hypothetical protein
MPIIANPLYDAAFKYLMQDNESAILLLSAILETEILELHFRPQEYVSEVTVMNTQEKELDELQNTTTRILTIYRMDFLAKIKTKDGFKNVIIEIQKSKFFSNIMRFREYLGNQYRTQENAIVPQKKKKGDKFIKKNENTSEPLPIIAIFILGDGVPGFLDFSIIHANTRLTDAVTKKEIKKKSKYFDLLHHESYTINVPSLNFLKRNDLEKLLQIFRDNKAYHFLIETDVDIPEKYTKILSRLRKAGLDEKLRTQMENEEKAIEAFANIEAERKRLENERNQLESERKRLEKEVSKLNTVFHEERMKAEEAKKQKDLALNSLRAAVSKFRSLGLSDDEIAAVMNISPETLKETGKSDRK